MSSWRRRLFEQSIRTIHDPNPDEFVARSPDPINISTEPEWGTAGPLGVYEGFHNLEVPALFNGERSQDYARFMDAGIRRLLPHVFDDTVSLRGILKLLSKARCKAAEESGDENAKNFGTARDTKASTPIHWEYLKLARGDLERLITEVHEMGADNIALFVNGGELEIEESPRPGWSLWRFRPAISIPSIEEISPYVTRMGLVKVNLTETHVYVDESGKLIEQGAVRDERGNLAPVSGRWRHHPMTELSMANRVWGETLLDLYMEGLYRKAKHPETGTEDTINAVAELHWWLAHGMPFNRGSAGITDALTKAIFYAKGIFPGRWRSDVSPDIKAFHTTLGQFVEQYRSLFI